MEEQIALLLNNIAAESRHPNYLHTIKVSEFCRTTVLGTGQEKILERYRRTEADELKKQRGRLTNTLTPFVVSRPRKYWQKVARVEGVNEDWQGADEDRVKKLRQSFDEFQDGMNLVEYLNFKAEYLGVMDPNAWIFFERMDERDLEGNIIETRVYPFVVPSIDVLNFQHKFGKLQWVIVRTGRMEYADGKETWLEDFYMYVPGAVIRAREIGEQTKPEEGEVLQSIKTKAGKDVSYYVSFQENDTVEVPGMCAGTYPDDETAQATFVPWFNGAKNVINDLIRDKSFLDVVKTIHAFPKRWEYTRPCTHGDPKKGKCEGGYYGGIRQNENQCSACGGSGKSASFTTEQQVLQLAMPKSDKDFLELSKLAFNEATPIDLPKWLDEQVKQSERRFMEVALNSGVIEKATGSADKTATLTNYEYEDLYDRLFPFARLISRLYELAARIGAQYWNIREFKVSHRFPKDFKMKTLDLLLAELDLIRQSGAGFYAITIIRRQILEKMHEDDPATIERIMAHYEWLPFDDKTENEVAQILSARSTLDDFRVLRENWLDIMQEIDFETKETPFYMMTYDRQKQVVMAKVAEYKSRITLPNDSPVETLAI